MSKRRRRRSSDKKLKDLLGPEKKPSFATKLKNLLKHQGKRAPITFNVGVAIILFFSYLSITFVSMPAQPQLLLILLPTLYILVVFIRSEREGHGNEGLR